jgi:hypothetical protein
VHLSRGGQDDASARQGPGEHEPPRCDVMFWLVGWLVGGLGCLAGWFMMMKVYDDFVGGLFGEGGGVRGFVNRKGVVGVLVV